MNHGSARSMAAIAVLASVVCVLHAQSQPAERLNSLTRRTSATTCSQCPARADTKCGTQAARRAALKGIRLERPPQGYLFVVSPHFIVHYDSTGPNKVARAYAESTSVYAEHCWAVQIDSLGWAPPPPDGDNGGDSTYDFYIVNIEDHGETASEDSFPNPYPDGYTSYILIDTGMSWDYLRGTVAHEFQHASQYRYSEVDAVWWGENTSTWMEDVCYDDINSYVEGLNDDTSALKMPNLAITDTISDYEYTGGIWAMFLAEYYNLGCPRRCWELMGAQAGENTISAIDSTLRQYYLSDLATALKKYAVWRYFTGPDRGDQLYHFSESSNWPASRVLRTHNTFPAAGNQGSYPPSGPGGASFVEFTSATDILNLGFDGQNGKNWSTFAIGVRSLHPSLEKEIGLDSNAYGTGYLPTANKDGLALATVVTQWAGAAESLAYKYQADVQTVGQDWVRTYDGPVLGRDEAYATTSDGSGNVFVTGMVYPEIDSPQNTNYVTIKYNSAGEQRWLSVYDGPGHAVDVPSAIAVDPLGNVYVTGYSYDATDTDRDIATVKYNSDGAEQWVGRYAGPSGQEDSPWALAVDDSGNVYVTGWSQGEDEYFDCVAVKYNRNGNEQWARRYDGSADLDNEGYSVGIDNSRNCYVTGYTEISASNSDYLTIKYNSAGTEQWVRTYDPAGRSDYATSLGVGSQGSIYVTGLSDSSGTYDIVTVKYDSAGISQWKRRRVGPAGSPTLRIDDQGNIHVAGTVYVSTYDIATIKYDPDGDEQWSRTYNFPGNSQDYARGMALDRLGNTYVCAQLYNQSGRTDYGIAKFDSAGVDQWHGSYNGPFNSWDDPYGITADDAGNVYVSGRAFVTDSLATDFATVKFVMPNDQPQISIRPRNLYLLLHQNQVVDTILKVFNEGTAAMNWTLGENPDVEWISEDPTSDSLSPGFWTDVAIRINTAGLAPGFYYTNLVLVNNDPNEPQRKVSVEIRVLPGTGVADGRTGLALPKAFALDNSLPNPFSARTLIRYAVPRPSQVRLAIYNCSGALVKTIRAGVVGAGYYQAIWNGKDDQRKPVSKGVYFCRLQADNFTAARKLSRIE